MRRFSILIVSAAVALSTAGAAAAVAPEPAATAAAAARQVEGTITAIDRTARTFKLRDSERGTFRIRVTSRTRYERLAGFGSLRVGMRNVEAVIRRSNGRWVASEVERSGGGGEHGGSSDDDGTDDRGRGRGSDDDGSDDRGRGRGRDDS
jgi:hypothetical protein